LASSYYQNVNTNAELKALITALKGLTNTTAIGEYKGTDRETGFNLSTKDGLPNLLVEINLLTNISTEGPFDMLTKTGLADYMLAVKDANLIRDFVIFDPATKTAYGFTVKGTGTEFRDLILIYSGINHNTVAIMVLNDGGASVFDGYQVIEEPQGGRKIVYRTS
jgi:hypothetical protein